MKKRKKNKFDKLAIGVFVDGLTLHISALCKQQGKVKLVDANIVQLAKRLEPARVHQSELVLDEHDGSGAPIDITSDFEKTDYKVEEIAPEFATEDSSDNTAILQNLLSTYWHRKYKLGISVSEPEIFYAPFTTNWGLKGDDLKRKIIENLALERTDAVDLSPGDVKIIEVANKDILAIVRGTEFPLLNLIGKIRKQLGNKITKISFIEGAEISLVNLVKQNYRFEPDEISVIIFIGHEYSRLIFMVGNELLGISQLIGEGIDSFEISHTIFSRLLLELDNFNFRKVDNVILCGEAYESDTMAFLQEKFGQEVDIEYLNFSSISNDDGVDPVLSRFAISVGVAWRALEEKNEDIYKIDLLPKVIRERQKFFKLGLIGWILLMALPFLTFFFTTKTAGYLGQVKDLQVEIQSKQAQLVVLEEPKRELEELRAKSSGYENIFARLDSLLLGTKTWSTFLVKATRATQSVGGIWITEIRSSSADRIILTGYSLYRGRIPVFSNRLGKTVLNKVEVQEIRERTVYNFELEVFLEPK
jgi:hypothetical protein